LKVSGMHPGYDQYEAEGGFLPQGAFV